MAEAIYDKKTLSHDPNSGVNVYLVSMHQHNIKGASHTTYVYFGWQSMLCIIF